MCECLFLSILLKVCDIRIHIIRRTIQMYHNVCESRSYSIVCSPNVQRHVEFHEVVE